MTTELLSNSPTIADVRGRFEGPYVRIPSGTYLGDDSHSTIINELNITKSEVVEFGRGDIEPAKNRATFYDDSHDFGYKGDGPRIETGQMASEQLGEDWNIIAKDQKGTVIYRSSDQR